MDGVSEIGAFSALLAGICLSAAAGLQVFIPLLALGLAGRLELLPLGEQFAWMTSEPFLIVVGAAAMLEAGAYYIPLVDNMLDVLATPAALAGGTVIVSSLLPEMNPVAQWTTAALLGGGTAGIVQTGTVLTRGASTITSAGLANPLVATGETGAACWPWRWRFSFQCFSAWLSSSAWWRWWPGSCVDSPAEGNLAPATSPCSHHTDRLMTERSSKHPVGEVFRVFLVLGLTSFGGPIAHLGYFRAEFITRRRWLTGSD